jgi:hypothetical protein
VPRHPREAKQLQANSTDWKRELLITQQRQAGSEDGSPELFGILKQIVIPSRTGTSRAGFETISSARSPLEDPESHSRSSRPS